MKIIQKSIRTALLALIALLFGAAFVQADTYSWQNFQSDIAGVALHTDSNLVNPWGMAAGGNGIIWVSNNGTGTSTLYTQDGAANPLVVEVAKSRRNHDQANPTGIVFNSTSSFVVTKNGVSGPAFFIFVNEDGAISGWNPQVDQTHSIIAVDRGGGGGHGGDSDMSKGKDLYSHGGGGDGDPHRAIFKGAALGVANGHNFLFATNFRSGRVETYDENFHRVNQNGFVDPNLPNGYAPFGIKNIDGQISLRSPSRTSGKRMKYRGQAEDSSMFSIRVGT